MSNSPRAHIADIDRDLAESLEKATHKEITLSVHVYNLPAMDCDELARKLRLETREQMLKSAFLMLKTGKPLSPDRDDEHGL
jgi:hypothetical protein